MVMGSQRQGLENFCLQPGRGGPDAFSGGRNGGKVVNQVGALGPAASKTNASWPAHRARAGGRSGSLTGGKSQIIRKPQTVFLPSPQKGTLPRPQPAQPVGGPLRAHQLQCEGRRPGIP